MAWHFFYSLRLMWRLAMRSAYLARHSSTLPARR
jgi:hypothetical protein